MTKVDKAISTEVWYLLGTVYDKLHKPNQCESFTSSFTMYNRIDQCVHESVKFIIESPQLKK